MIVYFDCLKIRYQEIKLLIVGADYDVKYDLDLRETAMFMIFLAIAFDDFSDFRSLVPPCKMK